MIQRETARVWRGMGLSGPPFLFIDPAFAHLPFVALVWAELPIISRIDTVVL